MPPKKVKTSDGEASAKIDDEKLVSTADFSWTWKKQGTLIYGDCGTKPSELILSMDMDDTLIKVKSGATFGKDSNDWILFDEGIAQKIKDYHSKGYKIVIFTNQQGITKGHTTEATIKKKIENIVNHIGVEFQAFIASDDDSYRKPSTAMWNFFRDNMNGGKKIDLKKSYYLGDAAGRPKTKTTKKDHSAGDYKFALNIGIPFETPETFFQGKKETLPAFDFNPKAILADGPIIKGKPVGTKLASDKKEMIILVGSPGSGKSSLKHAHLKDYVDVNNDTLKTKKKCLDVAEAGLKAGKSVVIDNTNPTKEARQDYIELAKKYNYPVRAFHLDLDKELVFHLNGLRKTNAHRNHHSKAVAPVIIHTWFKKLELPTKAEGFDEVETLQFVAGPFDNDQDKEAFFSY